MIYSTRHIAEMFEVSRETIRVWAREFIDYLSPGAAPGKGKTRSYNEDDAGVFSLVAASKNEGLTFEDIHLQLQAGQRGPVPDLVIEESNTLSKSEQLTLLQKEINLLQNQLKLNLEQLRQEKVASDLLREQLQVKERENAALHDEIKQLSRELGRLEARLEMLQDDDD